MPKFKQNIYLLILVLFSSIYYLSIADKLINFDIYDCGRDLYVSWRAFEGDLFLRDFEYHYGFLMPYIVSLFYRLLGVSMRTFNIAWITTQILIIIYTYKIARFMLSGFYSFISAFSILLVYYAFPQVAHNHIYGQLFGILSLYLIFKYYHYKQKRIYLILSALFCGFVAGVKLNMGLATLASNLLIIALFDSFEKNYFSLRNIGLKNLISYIIIFLIVGILPYLGFFMLSGTFKIKRYLHVWFTHGERLPFFHLKVYFDRLIREGVSLSLIKDFIMNNISFFVLISLFSSVLFLKKAKILLKERIVIISIIIFSLFKAHEYFLNFRYYSLTLWFFSPAIILFFWSLKELKQYSYFGRTFSNLTCFIIIILITIYSIGLSSYINSACKYYLNLKRGRVFSTSANDVAMISDTVNYIHNRISENDSVQSLFYHSLFGYLLGVKEVFWESFSQTAKGDTLPYSINDSLSRLRISKPRYIIVPNDIKDYDSKKEILEFIYANYILDKEFKPIFPAEKYQQLSRVRVYVRKF